MKRGAGAPLGKQYNAFILFLLELTGEEDFIYIVRKGYISTIFKPLSEELGNMIETIPHPAPRNNTMEPPSCSFVFQGFVSSYLQ
jgi:hypothetical protein